MIARHQIMDVRIGKRGQVVIPAEVRHSLGLHDGDLLQLTVDNETHTMGLKAVPSDPIERFRQAFKGCWEGVDAEAYIDELRNEWGD